jgi:hypothetical protein
MNPDDDKQYAESLLHDLAIELRRVPMCEPTRGLHLRALSLKREVSAWSVLQAGSAERSAVIEELGDLQRRAHGFRDLPTGVQLVRAIEGHLRRW